MTVREQYLSLLKEWMDALLEYQLGNPKHPHLHGALLCPACQIIHGRCADAVYPLLTLADYTGEEKYLIAARNLFDWNASLLCEDGSMYNDGQHEWRGITVFTAIAFHNAMHYHGHLLTEDERARWMKRLGGFAGWLYKYIDVGYSTNINYIATTCLAMALLADDFDRSEYRVRAKKLLEYTLGCLTEDGLLYGEGKPIDRITANGFRCVDMGYNIEESMPSILECAYHLGDTALLDRARKAWRTHIDFMLPDGAWDNSFGTRTFKWTYWGSRTSDGCQGALNRLGKEEPMYAEAALRNLELYRRCTVNGLFHGGPDNFHHGEEACLHHAFEHAKVLAQALDEGICEFERTGIPSDHPESLKEYRDVGIVRAASGSWRMTASVNDFEYMRGGAASGGAITLLWHEKAGPVFATANTDYSMFESHNMQLTRRNTSHRSLCPGVVLGEKFAQFYDHSAKMKAEEQSGGVRISVQARLADINHCPSDAAPCRLEYMLSADSLRIFGTIDPQAELILPVIARDDAPLIKQPGKLTIEKPGAAVIVEADRIAANPEHIFCLAPGFEAVEVHILPDENGSIDVSIRVE